MGGLRLAGRPDQAAPQGDPEAYGFGANTEEDQERLAEWLAAELCPVELSRIGWRR
ncbi:hypothetical protein [Streptomyces sp. NPDC057199]|uniref:hypothetical protein n=1 Tax=Streptomyces sp. NPDC057199 TaxID=3346047 RepID=UPI003632C3C0